MSLWAEHRIAGRHCSSRLPKKWRSEEHTSELQSQSNLVCRLLLEKKKKSICVGDTGNTTCITQYSASEGDRRTPLPPALTLRCEFFSATARVASAMPAPYFSSAP